MKTLFFALTLLAPSLDAASVQTTPAATPTGLSYAAVPAAIPTLGPALGAALDGYMAKDQTVGLTELRKTAYSQPNVDDAEAAAQAGLYFLLTQPKTANDPRIQQALSPEQAAKLGVAQRSLATLAKTDKEVKRLMSLSLVPSFTLNRLFDAVGETGRLINGASVTNADGAAHRLDDKTINDLELYRNGQGLHALLARTETDLGRTRVAYMLQHPSMDTAELRGRQEAVRDLLAGGETRKTVDAALTTLQPNAGADFTEKVVDSWRTGGFLMANVIHGFLLVILGGGLLLAYADGRPFYTMLGPAVMMWFMLGGNLVGDITKARSKYAQYKAAFAAARQAAPALKRSESAHLQELGRRLDVEADPALAPIAKSLSHLQPPSQLMQVLDFVLFQGAKTLWPLENRIRAARPQVQNLIGALAELDAYRALALYGEAHVAKGVPFGLPVVLDGAPRLNIRDGHNPYLALNAERSVPNDVNLGVHQGRKNFAVLTGSNMGGKSTYLKMGAQLQLLAQTGAPVPAGHMAFTPLRIVSSIDIRDNIVEGKSLYDAETDRALALVRAAEKGDHLIVMDEILQGTNPEESSAAQWALVRFLAKTRNLFTLATHNPKVTQLEGVEDGVYNLHVEERVNPDGSMTFPHRILPGPAVSRNGLQTLKTKGFPKAIVDEAERVVETNQKP